MPPAAAAPSLDLDWLRNPCRRAGGRLRIQRGRALSLFFCRVEALHRSIDEAQIGMAFDVDIGLEEPQLLELLHVALQGRKIRTGVRVAVEIFGREEIGGKDADRPLVEI